MNMETSDMEVAMEPLASAPSQPMAQIPPSPRTICISVEGHVKLLDELTQLIADIQQRFPYSITIDQLIDVLRQEERLLIENINEEQDTDGLMEVPSAEYKRVSEQMCLCMQNVHKRFALGQLQFSHKHQHHSRHHHHHMHCSDFLRQFREWLAAQDERPQQPHEVNKAAAFS